MYNYKKEQTYKNKNSNEHEYKKYRKKKTVTHITNHISLIIGLRDIPLRSIT